MNYVFKLRILCFKNWTKYFEAYEVWTFYIKLLANSITFLHLFIKPTKLPDSHSSNI